MDSYDYNHFFLDIYNEEELHKYIKDNKKILAYGNGSVYENTKNVFRDNNIQIDDVLFTENNSISSLSGKNYTNTLNNYKILICSSFYIEIFELLKKYNYNLENIRIAYLDSEKIINLTLQKQSIILNKITYKKKIRVLFLTMDISTWKLDSLYKKMEKDIFFEPIILVCPLLKKGLFEDSEVLKNLENTYKFFKNKKYNVLNSYKAGEEWMKLEEINPDIIFVSNPYNITKKYYYKDAYENYICLYVPYHHEVGSYWDEVHQYNKIFHNVMHKIYSAHNYSLEIFKRLTKVKGKNVLVTGFTAMESILYKKRNSILNLSVWKSNDSRKKIIWAPHHIIDEEKNNQSNFIKYADLFIKLSRKYKDKLVWCFKPHPLLKSKLYLHPKWGKEKTNEYFQYWQEQEYSQLNEGEYEDLFLTSDAMIHDSGSFLAEYLYVEKPVLYLLSDEHTGQYFNEFGQKALKSCNIAYNETGIELFLEKIITKAYISKKHSKFLKEEIYPYFLNDKLPSDFIIQDIKKLYIKKEIQK